MRVASDDTNSVMADKINVLLGSFLRRVQGFNGFHIKWLVGSSITNIGLLQKISLPNSIRRYLNHFLTVSNITPKQHTPQSARTICSPS